MAYLPETEEWEEDVYEIAEIDPILGGLDGHDNRPQLALANRTSYLRNIIGNVVEEYNG